MTRKLSGGCVTQCGASPDFIRLTRNPDLPRPIRFEPTRKELGDVIIGEGFRVERKA